jgi:flagellar FliL protein
MLSIMATSSPLPEVAASSPTANSAVPGSGRRSIASLLVAVVAGAAIASAVFGGALYCLARPGRLSLRKSAASKSLATAEIPTHLLVLDPLLVNLADSDGSTYAKLSITLQVEDALTAKDSKKSSTKSGDDEVAAVRDTALTVLGQQTADNLLSPHGKEDLKTELLKQFNQNNPGIKVKKILFTDFLVQR